MSGRPVLVMFTATLAVLVAEPVVAQTEMAIEMGVSQVGPAAGLDEESSRFGMGGLRLSHYSLGGSGVTASLMFGQAFGDPNGGDFVSGMLGGTLRDQLGLRLERWPRPPAHRLRGQIPVPLPSGRHRRPA